MVKVALVGLGVMAKEQHIPTIERNHDYELIFTVSGSSALKGLPNYHSIDEASDNQPDVDAFLLWAS